MRSEMFMFLKRCHLEVEESDAGVEVCIRTFAEKHGYTVELGERTDGRCHACITNKQIALEYSAHNDNVNCALYMAAFGFLCDHFLRVAEKELSH